MTLGQIIELFDRQRGGTDVPDHTAREIVKTLREVDDELTVQRQEIATHRTVAVGTRRARR